MNEGIFFRITVKGQARKAVFQNFIKCVGIAFIYLLISFSLQLIQFPLEEHFNPAGNLFTDVLLYVAASILYLLIVSPVLLGFFEFCMRIVDGKPVSAGDIFLWFGEGKRYIKSVLINFELFILSLLISLIAYLLPGGLSYYLNSVGNDSYSYILTPLMIIISVFVTARIITYFPGLFLLAETPEKKPFRCLMESRKIFKARKWDFFFFYLSFFGWIFLVMLIWETAYYMGLIDSGYVVLSSSGLFASSSIPVSADMKATVEGMVSAGFLLLYVLPYAAIATAYYVKGVINPHLLKIPVPAWYIQQKQNSVREKKRNKRESLSDEPVPGTKGPDEPQAEGRPGEDPMQDGPEKPGSDGDKP